VKEQASNLLVLLLAGAVNGAGQVTMRWGGRDSTAPFSLANLGPWMYASRWWLLGLIVTWSTGLVWAVMLRKVPIVLALTLFAGSSYVLALLGGFWILGERPATPQWLGLALVLAGILLIAST
jgi:multidrug transporter EmrE-like cation transporter